MVAGTGLFYRVHPFIWQLTAYNSVEVLVELIRITYAMSVVSDFCLSLFCICIVNHLELTAANCV